MPRPPRLEAAVIDSSPSGWRAAWPGLAVMALVASLARLLHGLLPAAVGGLLSEVLVGIALGLLLANTVRLPASLRPGLSLGITRLLPLAIILLGARLAFDDVLAMGLPALGLIAVVITTAFVVAHAVARALGVPRRVATLIAVGASICGNTAIAATAPAIRAQDDEVAFAIAVNTLFGTLAMLAFPVVGRLLDLPDLGFGLWAGAAVNDTAQVVATGFSFSEAAGEVATVVKLTRNASMVGVVFVVGLVYARQEAAVAAGDEGFRARLARSFPTFLLGFVALAAANSLGWIDLAGDAAGIALSDLLARLCRLLLLLALTSVALGTNLRALARTGLAPLWVGLATMSATAGVTLALVLLFARG